MRKLGQTWSFRGSKSRNKVSVGEPADGSLTVFYTNLTLVNCMGHSPTLLYFRLKITLYNNYKTFSNGSLGSRNDEERSELRKVM